MDGCIIFFMLDSQAAKYFSKIYEKKQPKTLMWFGEYRLTFRRNINCGFVSSSSLSSSHFIYN